MRRRLATLLFLSVLLAPCLTYAQLANPQSATFVSPDHATVIPPGQTNAGQPVLASYQWSMFPATADVSTGVPIAVGPVISKSLAVLQPSPAPANTYKLTFTQMGFTGANAIPVCTTLPCAQYTIVVVAIGPNGTSARGVAAESDPFTAALPVVGPPPASPASVKVGP